MIEVIDNFLSESDFNYICERVNGPHFPWYWSTVLDEDSFMDRLIYNFQAAHTFFYDGNISSNDFNIILPLLNKLNIKIIHRIKINANPVTSKIIEHGFHIDNQIPNSKTSIFYLNTNDGYTKFEETGEKINSVANRLITFDTDKRHTGTTCTNSSRRMVINLNYECIDYLTSDH